MSLKKNLNKKSCSILSKSLNDLISLSISSDLEKSKSNDSLENIRIKSRSHSLETLDNRCVKNNFILEKCFEPIKNNPPKKRRQRENKLDNTNSPKIKDVVKYINDLSVSSLDELKICDNFSISYEN